MSTADTSASALEAVRRDPTDLALLDLPSRQESGLGLLPQLKAVRPEMSVIMITGMGTIEDAVEAMRLGADNFVTKPIAPPRLLTMETKGFESRVLAAKTSSLNGSAAGKTARLLGESKQMREAIALGEAVAGRDTTALLRGETGTGKKACLPAISTLPPRAANNRLWS